MKKLLITMALLAVGLTAYAQLGAPATIIQSTTTDVGEVYKAITNNTTCTFTNQAKIDCTGGEYLCLQITAALSGAGTTANTIVLHGSVDNSTFSVTTPMDVTSIQWTPAGTTAVTTVTNLHVKATPYVRVVSIANANANTGYITNYSIKYFVK